MTSLTDARIDGIHAFILALVLIFVLYPLNKFNTGRQLSCARGGHFAYKALNNKVYVLKFHIM